MSIQHVVVVLFENRSYDNVLGRLYHPDNLPPYDKAPGGQAHLNGLTDSDSNPCPAGCDNNPCPPGVSTIPVSNQVTPTRIEGSDLWYAATAIPTIDPGEPFCDMAQQLLGLAHKPESNPYVDYPPRDRSRLCQGFTLNYAQQCWGLGNPEAPVPSDNIKDIMNCLTPAQMPVSAFLANRYALSDEWFASVPTQTFTNRAFAMCAAPGQSVNLLGERFSFIDDIQYVFNPLKPVRSVMRQLDEVHGRSVDGVATWKVYFHDYSVAVETVRDVADAARAADNINVASFDDSDWGSHGHPPQIKGAKATTFLHDVKAGKLPKFSFIEPRFFDNYARSHLPANHNHPGVPKYPTHLRGSNAPTDAATGEVFLMQLYNLLRRSPCWADTLLIISYDEHGGVFDHVPPPVAPPPGHDVPPVRSLTDRAANGFDFNVLGGRIPAIVVSPHIRASSVVRRKGQQEENEGRETTAGFDHTSIIRTVWKVFELDKGPNGRQSLTLRDLHAPDLMHVIQPATVNDIGCFDGQIVAGPRALNFVHHHDWPGDPTPQFVLASAGPDAPLTATVAQETGAPWLSVHVVNDAEAMISRVCVTVSVSGLSPATYNGTVSIAGPKGLAPVVIPVALIIRHFL